MNDEDKIVANQRNDSGTHKVGRGRLAMLGAFLAGLSVGVTGLWAFSGIQSEEVAQPLTSPSVTTTPPVSPTPITHDITGVYTLASSGGYESFEELNDGTCQGTGGFSDFVVGRAIVLFDAQGEQIGLGALSEGTPLETDDLGTVCEFTFAFAGVPDSPSYGFYVEDRGTVVYSKLELQRSGWFADLIIGDR